MLKRPKPLPNLVEPAHQRGAVMSVLAWSAASVAVLAMAVAACSQQVDNGGQTKTVGQKLDQAITTTSNAAASASKDVAASVSSAETAIKDVAKDAKTGTQDAAKAVVASVDDAAIVVSITASFAKDSELSAIKIDVDSKNGMVSLYGDRQKR
jgi:hyperosmotically inducible periplasmic protein